MADKPTEQSPYLRRPLYVYDLPPEILGSLTLRTQGNAVPELKPEEKIRTSSLNEEGVSTSTSCSLCRATFKDVNEQRQHVRSDFHRYNLKLREKGLPLIDEATFVKQIGDLDESISGSDSSESEDEDNSQRPGDSTLTALLRKRAKISEQDEDDSFVVSKPKRGLGGAPILWMSSPKVGNETGLGIYKAILSDVEQEEASLHLAETIKKKQVKPVHSKQPGKTQSANAPTPASTDPHFFLCMIGGGHFAAAIIGLAPEIRRGPGGIEERHAIVRAHKTFHRYTTRRKQGGSQSANDNSKGNAHSAGSSIRRYNEAALETDIRDILLQWKSMIDSAELVFVRASGTTNRRTLFGPYEDQVLRSNDRRLRGFPFSTRRATQAELLRSFQELTRLKISTFTQQPEQPTKADPTPKPASKPKPETPKLTAEEEALLLHTSQLQNLIRRTRAPALLLYLTKNNLSPNFPFHPAYEHHHAPTPLHLSASTNSPALITALLLKAHADPTLTNPQGKAPYDIAGDSKTRNAFRIARHTLGEKAWNWTAAHVPAPMSPEEADTLTRREEADANAAEAERKKADLQRIRDEEEKRGAVKIERKAGAGKTLGVGAVAEKTGEERREEEMRGLTPEMRMRLERERRARAAEARMKAFASGAGGGGGK